MTLPRPCATALLAALPLGAGAMELLLPAYFYPSFDPAQNPWIAMKASLA